jgi:hypothetical protein
MTPYLQSIVRAGTTSITTDFAPLAVERIHVDYDPTNPGFAFNPARVRIIVTPNSRWDPHTRARGLTTPVVRVENVTSTGFDISAFNPVETNGYAGFDWLAIEEGGSREEQGQPDLRMGLTQSQVFLAEGDRGDWCAYGVPYSSPISGDAIFRLLTGSNHGVALGKTYIEQLSPAAPDFASQNDLNPLRLVGSNPTVWRSNVMAVGVTTDEFNTVPTEGLTFVARNAEPVEGKCSYFFVALSDNRPEGSGSLGDLIVDSGTTQHAVHPFGYHEGWHIYFSRPFRDPPVVLATANDRGAPWTFANGDVWNAAHTVLQAHDVTRYGFTLVAMGREPDPLSQIAYADWVAFGCGVGCG